MNESYFRQLKGTLDGVTATLTAKKIDRERLAFGGEGAMPTKKPTVPTDARSEFLANRAMGDWAERMLCGALLYFERLRMLLFAPRTRIDIPRLPYIKSAWTRLVSILRYDKSHL